MKVKELIALLKKQNPEHVLKFDSDVAQKERDDGGNENDILLLQGDDESVSYSLLCGEDEKAKKAKKLFAIPFGEDDTAGDSMWNTSQAFECDKNDTGTSLKEKLKKLSEEDEHGDLGALASQDDYNPLDELIGFWIIDAKMKKTIDNTDFGDIGGDSAAYMATSTLKKMAKKSAIKILTPLTDEQVLTHSLEWVRELFNKKV